MTGGVLFGMGFMGGSGLPTRSTYHGNGAHYLSMTSANFGAFDEEIFAISVWVKKSVTGSSRDIFRMDDAGGLALVLNSTSIDNFEFRGVTSGGTTAFYLTTTAGYASTSSWYHVYARRQTGADTEIYVNGVEDTLVYVDSSNPIITPTGGTTVWNANGNLFQGAFISGSAPAVSAVYDAGKKSLAGVTGLHSMLDVQGGDVTTDFVRGSRWTNVTAVTASTTVPS